MVVYTIEYAPPLIVIVLAIIFWRIYRRENRIRNEREEKRKKEQKERLEYSNRIHNEQKERERQIEEKVEECAKSLETVIVQLTDEEMKKKKFCRRRAAISSFPTMRYISFTRSLN